MFGAIVVAITYMVEFAGFPAEAALLIVLLNPIILIFLLVGIGPLMG